MNHGTVIYTLGCMEQSNEPMHFLSQTSPGGNRNINLSHGDFMRIVFSSVLWVTCLKIHHKVNLTWQQKATEERKSEKDRCGWTRYREIYSSCMLGMITGQLQYPLSPIPITSELQFSPFIHHQGLRESLHQTRNIYLHMFIITQTHGHMCHPQ